MDQNYEQTLTFLERVANVLAVKVPQPKLVIIGDFRVFRYVEKIVHQAIIQKLARMVTTLDAARLLLKNGFVQEQAPLQRILDEINEDIWFLVFGVLRGEHELISHRNYLDAFVQEEFDADTAIKSSQKRHMIPQSKIQAYLAHSEFAPFNPSSGMEVLRTLSKERAKGTNSARLDCYVNVT